MGIGDWGCKILDRKILKIVWLDLNEFDISKINDKSLITFENKNINVLCKDVNWNLELDEFLDFLANDNLMLCFLYPKLTEINYLYINKEVKISNKKFI